MKLFFVMTLLISNTWASVVHVKGCRVKFEVIEHYPMTKKVSIKTLEIEKHRNCQYIQAGKYTRLLNHAHKLRPGQIVIAETRKGGSEGVHSKAVNYIQWSILEVEGNEGPPRSDFLPTTPLKMTETP